MENDRVTTEESRGTLKEDISNVVNLWEKRHNVVWGNSGKKSYFTMG